MPSEEQKVNEGNFLNSKRNEERGKKIQEEMTNIKDRQRRSNIQTVRALEKEIKTNPLGHKNYNSSLKYDRWSSAGNAAPTALSGSSRE